MSSSLDRPAVLGAVAALGAAAIIVFAVMPMLVGAMAERFALNDLQSGLIATAYFSTYALVALLSPLWVRRWNWRLMAGLGFLLLSVSLVLAMTVERFELAQIAIASAGIGAGLLFPISLTLASDLENAERAYAVKLTVEQLIPAFLLVLVSVGVIAAGLDSLLTALLVVVALCAACLFVLPPAGRAAAELAEVEGSILLSLLALAALAISFAGFAGVWVFLERIAAEEGFDSAFTSFWLAVGLVTSGVGPILAAVYADRFGVVLPIAGGMATALLAMGLLLTGPADWAYAAVLVVMPLAYYFALSYIMAQVAGADANGKMAGLMSFALALGSALGPALFGALRESDGPVLFAMAMLIAGGTAMTLWVAKRVGGLSNEE